MSWINDVVAGTKILAAWGNAIRDRTVTPFVNATERANAILNPVAGMMTWRSDDKQLEVFDGTNWVAPAPMVPLGAVIPYFGFAPPANQRTWALPNGQILALAQGGAANGPTDYYRALFNIIGTRYGGNGTTGFALPDCRGVFLWPTSTANGSDMNGAHAGATQTTLTNANLPDHTHVVRPVGGGANQIAVAHAPSSLGLMTNGQSDATYSDAVALTNPAFASQPFSNMPPWIRCQLLMRVS